MEQRDNRELESKLQNQEIQDNLELEIEPKVYN